MFKVHLQYPELPYVSNEFYGMVRVTPGSVMDVELPPKNLMYLLDVSTSVDVSFIKKSIKGSLRFLRDCDRVSIMSFSTETSLDVSWTYCTDENKERLLDSIDGISTGGWSNLSNGLFHAIEQCIGKDSHIILLSDGDANSGITNDSHLVRMVKNTCGVNTRLHTCLLYTSDAADE